MRTRRTWLPMVTLTAVVIEGSIRYEKALPFAVFRSAYWDVFTVHNIAAIKAAPDRVFTVLQRKAHG